MGARPPPAALAGRCPLASRRCGSHPRCQQRYARQLCQPRRGQGSVLRLLWEERRGSPWQA